MPQEVTHKRATPIDVELIEFIRANVDTPYPIASPDIVAATEASLGFELPPLLRELYLKVGNGGFGPQGSDLIGLNGGFQHYDKTLDSFYHQERTDSEYPYLFDGKVHAVWPEKLLIAFTWPCSIFSCIYCTDSSYPVHIYNCNFVGYCKANNKPVPILKHKNSFHEWLLARVEGEDLWAQMEQLAEQTAAEMERMEQEQADTLQAPNGADL